MQTSNQTYPEGPRIGDSEKSELLFRWQSAVHGLVACLTSHSSAPAARELYWHLQQLYLKFIRVFTANQ